MLRTLRAGIAPAALTLLSDCLKVGPDANSTAAIIKPIGRKAHLLQLCLFGISRYRNIIETGSGRPSSKGERHELENRRHYRNRSRRFRGSGSS